MFTMVLRGNIQSFFVARKGQMLMLQRVTCIGEESEWIF
jgi:hypothetical protein